MDLQKKFDIAVKLLDNGTSMDDIRFCSSKTLVETAWRLKITPDEIEEFAEEVAERSSRRAEAQRLERDRLASITILVTDDESSMTRIMRGMATEFRDLSERVDLLRSGRTVIFRVRNKELAERCSRILGRTIGATEEPLPTLKCGDRVLYIGDPSSGVSNNGVGTEIYPYDSD